MNRLILFLLLAMTGGFCIVGCSNNPDQTILPLSPDLENTKKGVGTIDLNITFATNEEFSRDAAKKLAATEANRIDKVSVYVTAKDINIKQDLDIITESGYANGVVTVPAPSTVSVSIAFFEASTVRWIGGASGVTVTAGASTAVTITVVFLGVTVQVPTNPIKTGTTYDITWAVNPLAIPFVVDYELQEANNAAFTSPTSFHTTLPSFTIVNGHDIIAGKSQSYWYRARINTLYGPGPWESPGTHFVNIQGPGSIQFHIPIPE